MPEVPGDTNYQRRRKPPEQKQTNFVEGDVSKGDVLKGKVLKDKARQSLTRPGRLRARSGYIGPKGPPGFPGKGLPLNVPPALDNLCLHRPESEDYTRAFTVGDCPKGLAVVSRPYPFDCQIMAKTYPTHPQNIPQTSPLQAQHISKTCP